MTATPLIYHDNLKTHLDFKNNILISMDDEANYGTVIYRLSFQQAVEKKLLTNYKLMIFTIDQKDLDQNTIQYLLQHKSSLKSNYPNFEQNIIKLLGCINALQKDIVFND